MGANVRRWMGRARGATLAEYLVLIILAVLVVMVGMRLFGSTLKDKYGGASDELAYLQQQDPDGARKGEGRSGAQPARGASTGEMNYEDPALRAAAGSGTPARSAAEYEAMEPAKAPPPRGVSVGGFNIITLLIFVALLGLLVYVLFAKKEG